MPNVNAEGTGLEPIGERQLLDHAKESAISPEDQQRSFFSFFLSWSASKVASADKMMVKANVPVRDRKGKAR